VVGLAADGGLPAQAKPGQVLIDGGLELGPATGAIDILDAQDETAAIGGARGGQRRKGVAAM
jgi:hypothetical protein